MKKRTHRLISSCAMTLALGSASLVSAALTVNPPQVVSHQVKVQLIQTALDNGTSPATVFGDATRRAAIEAAVDTIWGQAGIDVNFLPNVVRYNSTFAYQGALPSTEARPVQDLAAIMAGAQIQGGILHSDASVINMFFVNVVPGFNLKGVNWANGVGNIASNGIAMFIGASTSAEHAAHWVSHEIGHNLGLQHTDPMVNLMHGGSRQSSALSEEQISAVFQTQPRSDAVAEIPSGGTGFPNAVPPQTPGDFNRNGMVDSSDFALWRGTMNATGSLAADANGNGIVDNADYMVWRTNFGRGSIAAQPLLGDYNFNGVVDAADFIVWRNSQGSTSNLEADGNGNGVIDAGDYTTWRRQFGKVAGASASAAGFNSQFELNAVVPEPHSFALAVFGVAFMTIGRRRPPARRTVPQLHNCTVQRRRKLIR